MPSKLHVTGSIKSCTISDRHQVIKESKKFKLTVNLNDGNKLFLYTNAFGLQKLKLELNKWWVRELNDTD